MENDKEQTPAERVGAMTDAEVEAQLEEKAFGETVTVMDAFDPESNPMPPIYWVAGNPARPPRNFCSPDAPHSLVVEMVEAVRKACESSPYPHGMWGEFIKRLFSVGDPWSSAFDLLTVPPRTIARAALIALLAGKGAERE